jgi:hypothetical protein
VAQRARRHCLLCVSRGDRVWHVLIARSTTPIEAAFCGRSRPAPKRRSSSSPAGADPSPVSTPSLPDLLTSASGTLSPSWVAPGGCLLRTRHRPRRPVRPGEPQISSG